MCYQYDTTRNLETKRVEGLASGANCAQVLASPPTTGVVRTIATQWNATWRKPSLITELNKTTAFTYDPTSSLLLTRTETATDVTPNVARTWTYHYNTALLPGTSLLDTLDGPRTDMSDITTYTYYIDTMATHKPGDLWKITNALGHVTQFTSYDANGRPLSITDPNGAITALGYDALGRLTSRTFNGQSTVITYDNASQITRVTPPNGAYLNATYDAAHRLTDVIDNFGNKIHYTLDAMGNRTKEETKGSNNVLTQEIDRAYNTLNQLRTLTRSVSGANVGAMTSFTYDANGNQKRVIDPRDPAPATPTIFNENFYDALNRVYQVNDNLNGRTVTTYDVRDHPTTVSDPRNLPTSYVVNGVGDIKQQVSPDSGTTSYLYDEAGNLKQKTDLRNGGVAINYSYDVLNRLTLIHYPNAGNVDTQFTYDETAAGQNGKGRLTTMTDESGTTAFKYDLRGNVIEAKVSFTSGPQAKILTYGYDGADQLTSIGYLSGRVVNYTRDSMGRISDASSVQYSVTKPLLSGVTYAPFGPVTGYTYGNGKTFAETVDLSYRPTALSHSSLYSLSFTYDTSGKADDIKTLTDALNGSTNQSFTYDVMSRMLTASGLYGTQSFQYDSNGNRSTQTINGGAAQAYSYTASTNRLLTVASCHVHLRRDGQREQSQWTDLCLRG